MNIKTTAILLLSLACLLNMNAQSFGYCELVRNSIYAGIKIPIYIKTDLEQENVSLKISQGIVEKGEDGKFYVTVPDSMIGKKVMVSIIENKSNGVIGETKYRVLPVPSPHVVLGPNIRGGYHNADEILKYPRLRAFMNTSFPYDIKWSVASFRINIIENGKLIYNESCEGDTLPIKVQDLIRKARPNTSITFSEIHVFSEIGTKTTDDLTIFIK